MRAVLQRVRRASVSVEGEILAEFDEPGLVVLVGITHEDGPEQVTWMARKIRDLRLLHGERSVAEAGAPVLVISQFTLYGEARKGRRPTWAAAAPGEISEPLYEQLCAELERAGTRVGRGRFGADMAVELVNDGPVTLILDTP
jgi:D-tyrosyl-tRNA(Tyr) deacylase